MDTQTAFIYVAIAALLVLSYVIWSMLNKEPKIDIKTIPDDSLRPLVGKLLNRIDELQEQDFIQKNQIAALQMMAGVEQEQTKYLTANVNRTIQSQNPTSSGN